MNNSRVNHDWKSPIQQGSHRQIRNNYSEIPEELKEHFITLAPDKGLYEEQAIATDQALIDFHQKINTLQPYTPLQQLAAEALP